MSRLGTNWAAADPYLARMLRQSSGVLCASPTGTSSGSGRSFDSPMDILTAAAAVANYGTILLAAGNSGTIASAIDLSAKTGVSVIGPGQRQCVLNSSVTGTGSGGSDFNTVGMLKLGRGCSLKGFTLKTTLAVSAVSQTTSGVLLPLGAGECDFDDFAVYGHDIGVNFVQVATDAQTASYLRPNSFRNCVISGPEYGLLASDAGHAVGNADSYHLLLHDTVVRASGWTNCASVVFGAQGTSYYARGCQFIGLHGNPASAQDRMDVTGIDLTVSVPGTFGKVLMDDCVIAVHNLANFAQGGGTVPAISYGIQGGYLPGTATQYNTVGSVLLKGCTIQTRVTRTGVSPLDLLGEAGLAIDVLGCHYNTNKVSGVTVVVK